jgi:hypothetical protein
MSVVVQFQTVPLPANLVANLCANRRQRRVELSREPAHLAFQMTSRVFACLARGATNGLILDGYQLICPFIFLTIPLVMFHLVLKSV